MSTSPAATPAEPLAPAEFLLQMARGRVVLMESVLSPPAVPELGKLIDLEMLLMAGGRERTAEEFRALFDRAGFELTPIVPNQSPLSAIEARVRP